MTGKKVTEVDNIGSVGDLTRTLSREIPRLTSNTDLRIKSSLSLGISRDVLHFEKNDNKLERTNVVVVPALYASMASVNTLLSRHG